MIRKRSRQLYEEACKVIPGGVNSPVRGFQSVNDTPIFIKEAKGAHIRDVDGNTYIDYVCSWGPLILGHSSPIALADVMQTLLKGSTYGMPTEIETKLANLIVKGISTIDMIRMVSSGTEATMSAIRLARAYTKRAKILKFEGCYHGHSDGLLVKSGSGTLSQGVPTSEGLPPSIIGDTLVGQFNAIESIKALIGQNKNQIAAVIIEPIPANMGLIEERNDFLSKLRELTKEEGILLIFDEVITGFRIGFGGAAEYYGIEPDLICLGKIIGGGLPVGAYGGRAEIMSMVAPLGGVYQAGTLSGNPVAMKMGYNVLSHLYKHPEIYQKLVAAAAALENGFINNLKELSIHSVTINRVESMLCQFFTEGPVESYEQVMKADTDQYAVYFREMLKRGVLLPPAQYECLFLSTEHTDEVIEDTILLHYQSMKRVKEMWPEI